MIEEQIDELTNNNPYKEKKEGYGNMIVLLENPVHISLGPNYGQFGLGFLMVCSVMITIQYVAHAKMTDGIERMIAEALGGVTVLSYLLTAFSNPGIYRPSTSTQDRARFCHQCKHFTSRTVYHCLKCDVCIEGYDHHCPWMSKCVGRKNLFYFYAFMTSLSLFTFFTYYAIYRVISGGL